MMQHFEFLYNMKCYIIFTKHEANIELSLCNTNVVCTA